MVDTNVVKAKILELIQDDPLFSVIRETPLEEVLYNDVYLTDIIDKKYYSTPEVASWFEITDAQLRYYIKPFESYIFDDEADNPTTPTVIRLNFPAILRLRMILLLKDEYRVKGLKRLLDIDENGYIVKQRKVSTEVDKPNELANKVDVLSNVMQQILQTGLFELQENEESGSPQITLNQNVLSQNIKMLTSDTTEQLAKIQESTEKIQEENQTLKKQIEVIQERSKTDIVQKIRERQIENRVVNTLRKEALEQFEKEKKSGLFAKLFRSSQIEAEKEEFVAAYIQEHLYNRLQSELERYYGE